MRNKFNQIISALLGFKLIRKNLDIHLQIILDEKYGHRLSRESKSAVDEKGCPMPWITYPAYEYINQLDLSEKEIFEWGCGNSTKYFASRCKSIISIESNRNWFESVRNLNLNNAQILLKSAEEFPKAIAQFNKKFDIIFIDSDTRRLDCAKEAVFHLKEDGVIILDNSDRFQKAAETLKNQSYIQVDMHGFGPIAKYTFTTSLFFTRKANFKSINPIQPSFSKGAISQISE